MKVFTSNDFEGLWPVGTAAVIVAEDEDQARDLLWRSLDPEIQANFHNYPCTIKELNITRTNVIILNDGNY